MALILGFVCWVIVIVMIPHWYKSRFCDFFVVLILTTSVVGTMLSFILASAWMETINKKNELLDNE